MLAKRRGENPTKKRQSVAEGANNQTGQSSSESDADPVLIRLAVAKILMRDYEANHLCHDKERLRQLASPLGALTIPCSADLEQVSSYGIWSQKVTGHGW